MPAPNASEGLNAAIAAAASAELPDEATIDAPPTDEAPLGALLSGDLPVDPQVELPEAAGAAPEDVPPELPEDLAGLLPEDLPEDAPPEVPADGPDAAQVADPDVNLPSEVPEFLMGLFAGDFAPAELLPDLVLDEDLEDLLPDAATAHGPFALGLPFGLTLETAPTAAFDSGPFDPFAPFDGIADLGAAAPTVDIADLLPDLGATQIDLQVAVAPEAPIQEAPPGEAPPTVEVGTIVFDVSGSTPPVPASAPVADVDTTAPPVPTIDLSVVSGLSIPDPAEVAALVS